MPPEIFLASSALINEGFDGRRTIEEAKRAGFDGVQLFLDKNYRNDDYLKTLLGELKESGLGLVLHLPNIVEEEDKKVAEEIVKVFPKAKVLVHYLPAIELPDVKGTVVGWENSMVGPLNNEMRQHIENVKRKVCEDNTFLVYDMGRQLYLNEEADKQEAINYIREQLKSLDPKKDIIHLADKTSWTLRFRDSMCVLGDGVMAEFLEDVLSYDGIVVFEYEDLEIALESLTVMKNGKIK